VRKKELKLEFKMALSPSISSGMHSFKSLPEMKKETIKYAFKLTLSKFRSFRDFPQNLALST
jgi:hypothetical protein